MSKSENGEQREKVSQNPEEQQETASKVPEPEVVVPQTQIEEPSSATARD